MIKNEHLVTDIFGHWPSFHDAEIQRIRMITGGNGDVSVEVDVEVHEPSPQTDARGYFIDRHRCRTVIRFDRALNVEVVKFGSQNVINDLIIVPAHEAEIDDNDKAWGERLYRVTFEPIPAFCWLEFDCDEITIVSAVRSVRKT